MKSLKVTSTVTTDLDWQPHVVVADYNSLPVSCKEELFACMYREEKEKIGLEIASCRQPVATLVYKENKLVGWALKAGDKVVASKVLGSEKQSLEVTEALGIEK